MFYTTAVCTLPSKSIIQFDLFEFYLNEPLDLQQSTVQYMCAMFWVNPHGCIHVTVCASQKSKQHLLSAWKYRFKPTKPVCIVKPCTIQNLNKCAWIFILFENGINECGTGIWSNANNQLKCHIFQRFVAHIICFSGPLWLANITL